MEWLVRLEGDEWSLEDLTKWFSQLDHKVKLEDDKYYLTSSWFEHCTTSAAIWEAADQIVAWINGIAKALDPRFARFRSAANSSRWMMTAPDGYIID